MGPGWPAGDRSVAFGWSGAAAARAGRWATSFTVTGAADQGVALDRVLRCRPYRSYAATIWVQASRPGVLVEVNLRVVVHKASFMTHE
jgi:hypothetical protein